MSSVNEKKRVREKFFVLSLVLGLVAHVLSLLIGKTYLASWVWEHHNFHVILETAGSLISLIVAKILLHQEKMSKGTSFNIPIAAGLISMGILDGVHACFLPGQAFVWFHSMATFVGGFCFSLVWVKKGYFVSSKVMWPLVAGVGSIALGILGSVFPELIPEMVNNGHFTNGAILLNVSGGSLFLLAALKLYLHYMHHRSYDDVLFFLHCLFFGLAALMFQESKLWDFSWWSWHILRLAAYAIALLMIFNVQEQLGDMLSDQRVEAEKNLQRVQLESEMYRLALDRSSIVAFTDAKGVITFVNDMFCAISKYDRRELIGKTHKIVNSGKMEKGFFREMWGIIGSGKVWSGVICNKAKDGSYYWVDTVIVPHLSKEGNVEKYIAIRNDVTEKVKQKRELDKALGNARRAAEAKSIFLANMSHEIRTPLNGILGVIELLRSSIVDKEMLDKVNVIQSSGRGLLSIINDILDFSKIESGKIKVEEINFNLHKVLQEIIELFSISSEEKGIAIILEMGDGVPKWIVSDPFRMRQIINNLIGNAIKFSEKGRIFLRSCADETEGNKLKVYFEVEDEGIGIPPESLDKLFGDFSQVDASISRKYGGSGLGLSISKGLIEKMGGEIKVESTPGKGSKFNFYITCEKGQPETKDKPGKTLGPVVSDLHALVVDDNAVNRMVAKGFLEKIGHTCDLAINGEEALKSLENKSYDYVLMDCQMPVMDGYEATRQIIKKYGESGPYVIALTAGVLKEEIQKCYDAGMDDFLSKPILVDDLKNVIKKIINKKK